MFKRILDNIFNPFYFNFKDISSEEKQYIIKKIYTIRKYRFLPLDNTLDELFNPTGFNMNIMCDLFKEFDSYKIKISSVYFKFENVFPIHIYIIKETNERCRYPTSKDYNFNIHKRIEIDDNNKYDITFKNLI